MALVLTGKDVSKLLEAKSTIDAALESQQRVFVEYSRAQQHQHASTDTVEAIQAPLRATVSSDHVNTLVMPARAQASAGLGGIGIKVVSVPKQGDGGLPGTTTLFDEKTGQLRALVNARALTALRNACGSTLYLRSVMTDDQEKPSHLVLFGSGAQIKAHALLIHQTFPSITAMTIVARRETGRLSSLVDDLESTFKQQSAQQSPPAIHTLISTGEPSDNLSSLIQSADIIVAATPSTTPLFPASYVRTSQASRPTTIVLIGSYKPHMLEVSRDLINKVLESKGKISVDSRTACLAEAGELIGSEPKVRGDQVVELGEMLGQRGQEVIGYARAGPIRVYKSVSLSCRKLDM